MQNTDPQSRIRKLPLLPIATHQLAEQVLVTPSIGVTFTDEEKARLSPELCWGEWELGGH